MSALSHTPSTRRLFFALWPGAADAARMMAWVEEAHRLCGGRMMRQDTLHLTLAFLGDTPVEQVQVLQNATPTWHAYAQPLTLQRFGCFQGPRVVWAGPTSHDDERLPWLDELHNKLWQHLEALGWQRPQESFRPHVSLLRKATLRDANALQLPAPLRWTPEQCLLVASTPGDSGSYYEVLARMPLHISAGDYP